MRADVAHRSAATRVLLLSQDLKLAGAQRQLVELALGLARAGYDVRVGVLEPGGPLSSDLMANGVPVVPYHRRWRWDLSPIVHLARDLRDEAIDVVHAFLFLPSFYARVAGYLAPRTRVVSSLRGTGIEGRHRYWLDVAMSRLSDAVVANSAAGRADYLQHGGRAEQVTVIANGIDVARFEAKCMLPLNTAAWRLERFEQLIGMVGTLEPLRDHRGLIEALQRVVVRRPRTGLVLVGDGSLRAALEDLVRARGLSNHVVFTGTLRHPEPIYGLLDVYVQASATEGVSNSVLEAMLCARPVVATAVGGNPEVVQDGTTGFLVLPGRAPDMAARIEALLGDPQLRDRLGRNGRERARAEFSLASLIARTASLYGALLPPPAVATAAAAPTAAWAAGERSPQP